jgi:Xaa-Pro aminopeptidase
VPEKYAKVFAVTDGGAGQSGGVDSVNGGGGKPVQGWQVDKAARGVVERRATENILFTARAQYRDSGSRNGVNMDGLETHDSRHLIAGTCNSIEPGIYLPEFGMRSEVNVYVGEKEARVTGAVQKEILALLA